MRDGPRDALNPEATAESGKRADDIVVERHMGERRAVFGFEVEVGEADSVAHLPVHNNHRQDRLRMSLNRRPGANPVEQAAWPIGDRDRAQRARACRARHPGIDDADGRALSHRLFDRSREGQSGRAGAGDHDVENGSGCGHAGRLLPPAMERIRTSISALGPQRHFRVRIPSFQGVAAPFPSRRGRGPMRTRRDGASDILSRHRRGSLSGLQPILLIRRLQPLLTVFVC